jgi:hypothetical protein
MSHKKKVTDAVRAANRANAQSSTGPRTEQGKSNSSNNAVRHGILSRKVEFDDDEQRAEFLELRQRCKTELQKGLIERFLVEEIATLLWKLGITEFLEFRELSRHQGLSDDVGSILDKDLELPIRDLDLPLHLPLDRGWGCERMVVRAVAAKDHHYSSAVHGPGFVQGHVVEALKSSQNNDSKNGDHLEIEAVMGSALESMTRYQARLKRDLYRAIETLRKMQTERREGEN